MRQIRKFAYTRSKNGHLPTAQCHFYTQCERQSQNLLYKDLCASVRLVSVRRGRNLPYDETRDAVPPRVAVCVAVSRTITNGKTDVNLSRTQRVAVTCDLVRKRRYTNQKLLNFHNNLIDKFKDLGPGSNHKKGKTNKKVKDNTLLQSL